jgi:hypothetical protein
MLTVTFQYNIVLKYFKLITLPSSSKISYLSTYVHMYREEIIPLHCCALPGDHPPVLNRMAHGSSPSLLCHSNRSEDSRPPPESDVPRARRGSRAPGGGGPISNHIFASLRLFPWAAQSGDGFGITPVIRYCVALLRFNAAAVRRLAIGKTTHLSSSVCTESKSYCCLPSSIKALWAQLTPECRVCE